ncbi:Flp pilus assembly protein CpaB [Phenylobacterium soli]|uniref:Flp pilus assembly protein CpaB n=1 Tax=Phenylobacterium soli TaxID=2170551 RepID=A0A328AMZ8_9CAUL|nr:Flp pilus assembly protein CpaB [Phenylobacterium soli]RAK55929.1 Flp pilus assembly protein CpaB [Phenylobacterium soli]
MTPFVRNILLAVGALALLTGVAIGVVWLRSGGPQSGSVQAEKAGPAVLVAAKAIEPGTLLRPEDLTWREIGEAKAPAGAFVRGQTSETEIAGSVSRRAFAAGEVIAQAGILRPTERGFLAATLRPGYRAATISVDAPQTSSGLVLPGDRVDVILVQQLDGKDAGRKSVGETVLQDARVVAVGHAMQPANEQGPNGAQQTADTAPRTLTLEALPTDAERLFVASQLGKLEVALRPVAEPKIEVADRRPVWAGDVSAALGRGAAPAPSAAAVTPKRAPQARRADAYPPVQILRGSKSTQ